MTTNVLVLCTHNSARSVLAEAMLNHLASAQRQDVRAVSAGRAPSGRIHTLALDVLRGAGIDVQPCRSKSWDEFARLSAPRMRIVITVCDSAAAQTCPYWPGSPVQVHWGYPDPSNAPGADEDKRIAFELTRQAIGFRMLQLLRLPLATMTDGDLQAALQRMAHS
jgi:arsenate reductase